ncbi:MAG: MFS transporter [Steroidobacteraceae bacterium]
MTFGFQPPLIALVLGRAGHSNFAVGAVTAASLIAVILFGPFYPPIMRRLGLRRSVITGIGIGALVLALMPLWPGVGFWFLMRFLTGCALGLSWIASEVWLNSVSGPDARGTLMGVYGTVFSTGALAGPALLEATGTLGWRPFAAGACALLVTLLPLLLLRRVVSSAQPFTPIRELRAALGRAPIVMLAALVAGLVESAELTLLPLYAVHTGFDDRQALLLVAVFMAGNVALQAPIGVLADRFGRRRMLTACALISTVGPLLLQPWMGLPVLLWPLLFVWGGTVYAFYSQGIALLGSAFAIAELPSGNTLFVMIYCLGGVVGPSVGGVMMDAWPRTGMQLLLSASALILLAGLMLRTDRT